MINFDLKKESRKWPESTDTFQLNINTELPVLVVGKNKNFFF